MQSIKVVNNNKKTSALLIPKNEWTRLKKILTKKDEDKAAIEKRKQLKDERYATSKAMSESWATTILNKRKKGHEDKLKLLAFREARQHEKDEILKHKILKRRNAIVEKALLKKWLDRDSTKALTRVMHEMEVFRERSMQIKFNEAQKAKELEADCLLKIEQNLDAERYKADRWEQKLKQAETKKAYAAVLLNELKERETIKSDNDVKLREEGKAELQRIANEIAEDIKNKNAKTLATRENLINHISESRKIMAENIKRRQLEDEKENVLTSIMAEVKKEMAKKRKLKEIEILKEKQLLSKKVVKPITNTNQDKEDIAFQNAIKEKEKKYQEEELKKNVWMKKRKEDFEKNKKILDEENRKEKERLTLSYQWEMERNLRETEMLRKLETSRNQAKTREINRFRENLNKQRDNNIAATRANKRVDIEEYNAQLKLWRQQDEELMAYGKNMITKYKKDGISVIPLIKAMEDNNKAAAI